MRALTRCARRQGLSAAVLGAAVLGWAVAGAAPAWACRSPGSIQGVVFDVMPPGVAPPKSVWGGRISVSDKPWKTYRWRGQTLSLAARFHPTPASAAGFGDRTVLLAILALDCSSPGTHGLEGMIVGQEISRDRRQVIILADQDSIVARRSRRAATR